MRHHKVALTPPMGWNSWDCYGASVTEDEVRHNAEYMAANMREYGWTYVVVDIQWYEATADGSQYHPFTPLEMDAYSRLVPAVNRFPSAASGKGFAPLASYIHSLDLKFGIHIMRGIPRQAVHNNTSILGTKVGARDIAHTNSICPWNTDMYGVDANKPGSQEYYDSLFSLYATWGVDFVKVDDIAASRLYGSHSEEIGLIRRAIDKCGRDMVLSLSPGPAPIELAGFFRSHANMWRMTDDFWDHWEALKGMFARCEQWCTHVGPGHWPDADMLPLGHIGIRSSDGSGSNRQTRFTRAEQITMMTLWCVFHSPLFMGGEMRDNDDWTLSLLTNPEVLEVHRESHGNRQVYRDEREACWMARMADGRVVVALFNLADDERKLGVTLDELGVASRCVLRDLWLREDVGPVHDEVEVMVPAHGARLCTLTAL